MKKLLFLTILISASILVSCAGDHADKNPVQLPAIEVKTGEVTRVGNSKYIAASGKIETENSADLSTRMMGFVSSVKVKTGQKVNTGQLLLHINNSDLQAKKAQTEAVIIQASAAYNNAKKDYDRFTTLYQQQSASQKELDDITAQYEMAKAGLEAAQQVRNEVMAQFSYTNITAPFSGVITRTFVKEGDMATPGMPLISIEGGNTLQAVVMVSESDIFYLKENMKADVTVKSLDKTLTGKITEISSSARNSGGQYIVKITLEQINASVLSGMFVNVVFPIEKQENHFDEIILLPKSALISQGQLHGIYVVNENNIALLRWLRLGKSFGDQIEVLSGLAIGEKYVIEAQGKLFNGAKVNFR